MASPRRSKARKAPDASAGCDKFIHTEVLRADLAATTAAKTAPVRSAGAAARATPAGKGTVANKSASAPATIAKAAENGAKSTAVLPLALKRQAIEAPDEQGLVAPRRGRKLPDENPSRFRSAALWLQETQRLVQAASEIFRGRKARRCLSRWRGAARGCPIVVRMRVRCAALG